MTATDSGEDAHETDSGQERTHEHVGSRRSLATKGALAGSAVTLGAAGSATAQEDEEVLVYSYSYWPDTNFEVLSRLQQSTTVDLLEVDGEMVDVISQPDNWNGHVIRYDRGTETAGLTTFLFLRDGTFDEGDTETLSEAASMFSSRLNLLSTSLD
ncbi:calcium-binding protein [Natrinema halophilum]|uniref:calcium-binding protein n=1 Tax=Natrinema halophilum TaxID=1699371 RepID=UPI001F3CF88A|nr:calcium-binding protein [Natrinema halophilum]UHQ96148.1 calcium-binding protein [Natrinema halophilum]